MTSILSLHWFKHLAGSSDSTHMGGRYEPVITAGLIIQVLASRGTSITSLQESRVPRQPKVVKLLSLRPGF
jgi:hypothetical protein